MYEDLEQKKVLKHKIFYAHPRRKGVIFFVLELPIGFSHNIYNMVQFHPILLNILNTRYIYSVIFL